MREEAYARLSALLPRRVVGAMEDALRLRPALADTLSEVRLRADRYASLTAGGRNYPLPVLLSAEELSGLLVAFCRGSLYAYRESLSEGYVDLGGGIRCGVSGRAVLEGGRIKGVTDVTSLVLRLPREVRGAGDGAYNLFLGVGGGGMLIFSPPGVGKTTLLRDLCRLLSTGEGARRVAVVDSRGELSGGYPQSALIDVLVGYPKAIAIELAVRTLSPEVVAVDEIGSRREAEAVLAVAGCGVPLIATTHASSLREALARPAVRPLVRAGLFPLAVGLTREGGRVVSHPHRLGSMKKLPTSNI